MNSCKPASPLEITLNVLFDDVRYGITTAELKTKTAVQRFFFRIKRYLISCTHIL